MMALPSPIMLREHFAALDGSQVLGKAIPVLVQHLGDSTPRIRTNAAYALANLKPVIPPAAASAFPNHATTPILKWFMCQPTASLGSRPPVLPKRQSYCLPCYRRLANNQAKGAVWESIRSVGVKGPGLAQSVGALLSPDTDAQLVMSALGIIRSFGPEAIQALQGRINALEFATSNRDVAATARTMLQGATR
jgi:HEAT repeat protein